MTKRGLTLVVLGRATESKERAWREGLGLVRTVRLTGAAPSGSRFGSRALGLGLDSALVALKALAVGARSPFLATNPWIAVALKATLRRRVAVTGIYAVAGSRSFKMLRLVLRDSPVVTTVRVEAEAWTAAGGRAVPVVYGNTFGYPESRDRGDDVLHIFVGGSSDRDTDAIDQLEREIRSNSAPIALTVVGNEDPSSWSEGNRRIEHTGRVSPDRFGNLLSKADVVFLPLVPSDRAAGHMVTVGALESGLRVLTSDTIGMTGYVDGRYVRPLKPGEPLLAQLEALADRTDEGRAEARDFWRETFSVDAYVARVRGALRALSAPKQDA